MASDKITIAFRADPLQAERLRQATSKTGRTQTEVIMDGIESGAELARVKSENATLRLELQELYGRKATDREQYPKSAQIPLTLQEHAALKKAAFDRQTTMGLLLRGDPDTWLAAPVEMPALEVAG